MTEKQSPYMNSNFARVEDDFYKTIDTRCVDGLLHFVKNITAAVDICAPSGSGIVERLVERGCPAWGVGDAFCDSKDLRYHVGQIDACTPDWIVTNTPYKLSEVDRIILRQIERVKNREITGAAFLLRTGFDHAAKRDFMFSNPLYMGQIKLCFRPWWNTSRDKSPFHSYAWQIFRYDGRLFDPIVLHYYAPYEKRYAADIHGFKCRVCGASKKAGRIKYTSQDKVGACPSCGDPEYSLEAK